MVLQNHKQSNQTVTNFTVKHSSHSRQNIFQATFIWRNRTQPKTNTFQKEYQQNYKGENNK